jgi:hypothetical protein
MEGEEGEGSVLLNETEAKETHTTRSLKVLVPIIGFGLILQILIFGARHSFPKAKMHMLLAEMQIHARRPWTW